MKSETKLKAIKLQEVCVSNSLGHGIARTIWGDHQRYKETYFSLFQVNISLVTVLYEMK
jgi:acyl-coenzyme A synthetase/AMP-(fatty) acid ligase